MDKQNVIPFPGKRQLTPNEVETFKNDEAHQIAMEFIDLFFITDDDEQVEAMTRLRERALDYGDAFNRGMSRE